MSDLVLVDDPRPRVRRLTLNRPQKRNALSNALRAELFERMREADLDDDVSAIVLRGAGPCWSAGYDLTQDPDEPLPRHTTRRTGFWARHVVEGWFEMWDYDTPLIAQVHGYCLAGGSELATACDLVYVAEDAVIGYPATRSISPPDMNWQPWLLGFRRGMEAVLTGDPISGVEAARSGFANRALPLDELEDHVLAMAERVAQVPLDILAVNKRSVHRAMDVMGIRTSMRATTDSQAIGTNQPAAVAWKESIASGGLTKALDERDGRFADYRTAG